MHKINICTWNANGIRHKVSELIEFLSRLKIDVMLISETKLSAKDRFKIRGYTCERYNRDNAVGGVMILVKNNVPFKIVKTRLSIIENCTKLVNEMHIFAAYNRPTNQYTKNDLDESVNVSSKTLVVGDLNSRHKACNCHISNKNGRNLYKYSQENKYSIIFPDRPTQIDTTQRMGVYLQLLTF